MALCCNLFWASFSLGLVAFCFPEVGVRLLAAPGQVLGLHFELWLQFLSCLDPLFWVPSWVP